MTYPTDRPGSGPDRSGWPVDRGPRPPFDQGRRPGPQVGPQQGAQQPYPGAAQPPARSGRNPLQPGNISRNLPAGQRSSAWSQLGPDSTTVMPPAMIPDPADEPQPRRGGPGGPGGPRGPRGPVGTGGPGPRQVPGPSGRRRASGGLIAGRIVATAVSVVVLAASALFYFVVAGANKSVADSDSVADAGEAGVVFRGGVNILLVGSDARTDQDGNPLSAQELQEVLTTADGGGVNTDTIMIVHIPEGGGQATAVSIPRDTWIPQSVTNTVKGPDSDGGTTTYKPNKINSFYGAAKFYDEEALAKQGQPESPARERATNEAGRTMLISIVQAFTGLKITHYAEVNLIGFYELSQAIGGVPVCLNAAVNDPFSGANFKAGPQEVAGSAAMAFVRQRHGLPDGDLDRVRRQQAFLAGATKKMLSAGTLTSPSKLSNLMDAAGKSLTLDKGFDLLSFASQMAGLSGGNVTFTTIPTHGASTETSSDALATDPAEIKAFFTKLNGGSTSTSSAAASSAPATVSPSSVTIDVKDATADKQSGTPVMDKLVAAGYQRGSNQDADGIGASNEHRSTTIAYPKGAAAAAAAVQKSLGFGTATEDDSVEKGHVLVVVGTDSSASGLRAPMAALAAPTTPTSSDQTLSAAGVPCVN
jgi:LCP family protein required for cell wall assembly